MARTDLRALLLVGLLALSGAGLVALGISAADAAEARAELQARHLLEGAADAVAAGLSSILRDADAAADAWKPEAPPHPLLTNVFVTDEKGRLLYPGAAAFPAVTPPSPDVAERARRYRREALSLDRETGEEILRTAAYEEFTHPDLVAILVLSMADLAKESGDAGRAAYLYGSISTDLPGARDLDGEAIAPTAHLRRLSVLEEASERRDEAATFALRLADRAWDLPRVEREMLLARLAEEFENGELPEDVLRRKSLVDAVGMRSRAGSADGGWRHESVPGEYAVDLVGWRELVFEGRTRTFGYRIEGAEFARRARVVATTVHERFGTAVGILALHLSVGSPGGDGALVRMVDLPAEFGDLEAGVLVARPDDLGGLRVLHVGMTLALAAALTVGVFFSLRAVRRELATARVRQNLLDNTSHELRTPLTTIRMHAEMLAEESLPDDKRETYLRLVLAESERLSRLVDDVLDLSKLSHGEAPAATEPAAPVDLARAAVQAWSGEDVGISVPEDLPLVTADRDAAIRVLLNLLENARKYAGGAVGIEGRAGDGAVELIVADRGPGIPEEEREQLFTRFYRSPRDARRVKGVGLGLVLAREIARSQGGDVSLLTSSAEGSRFALRLPVVKEAT